MITADTTRADYLGCYGRQGARTPNLDRLAREGTRFARCSACTPLTAPSHCTILTGTYPFVHCVRANGLDRLAPENVTLAEILNESGFATHAVVASFVLKRMFGLSQGFETYSDVVTARGANPAAAERKGDDVCDDALTTLRAIAGGRFFLWVHFYDPHYPYESSRVSDVSSPEAYADEIAFMDVQIGRLLEALVDLGIERKTLVVLVGDHGEGLGDHGESEHGYFVYETCMHVPLIVRCPGAVPAGQVVEARVRTVDIVPTVLDYLGLPTTPDRQPAARYWQGTSVRSLVEGRAPEVQLAAYGESKSANGALGLSVLRTLHNDGWKYILSSRPELYNLDTDPKERNDRIAEKPELAARMREQLWTLLAESPPPPGQGDIATVLSPEEKQRLASLGYVSSRPDTDGPPSAELAAFEPVGDNPADHAETVELYVQAHRLMAEGRHEVAEEPLRRLLTALPTAPAPRNELAQALRRMGREDEMLEVCEKLLEASPDATGLRLYYGRQMLRAERLEEAASQLAIVVAQDPQHGEAHLELANTLRRLDRPAEARAHYEQALQVDPRNNRALHALAMLCRREGELAEAAKHLREALKIDPNSARLKRDLQRVLEEMEP
jgi:Flp pilus assembly protein TadD